MDKNKKNKSLFVGLLLIIVGLVIALERLNYQSNFIETYLYRWESFLILVGVLQILVRRKVFGGLMAVAAGVYFLMDDLYFIPASWDIWFFPILLILGGIAFIFAPDSPYCSKNK
ncbi:hypothetical protein BZG02_07615 [Labilibaculum filiforme]|uniref:LiaF transmembrane domain-containing protein n=1 Tax=Labilibaculum filiforme TaxID=1940526 RepID=A0A2N3I0M9_9BACT|nr:DUF5668 domain-containing protein [Labilibaculum filiforme]PKQ63876.1 hypothetical protein BZG02_07615 [Labilibaculum filiforme]